MKFTLVKFGLLKKDLKKDTPVQIVTSSMSPWIKAGETVLISPIKITELKPFDIIIYWDSEAEILICHIFKEIRDNKLITKPLSTNTEDSPFNLSHLLGIVTKPQFKWYHKLLLRINY